MVHGVTPLMVTANYVNICGAPTVLLRILNSAGYIRSKSSHEIEDGIYIRNTKYKPDLY